LFDGALHGVLLKERVGRADTATAGQQVPQV
jgi:hypothetical protein